MTIASPINDRWVHKIPESPDWALAVQTLGGIASYREVLKLREPKMTRKLRHALESGQDAMRRRVAGILRPIWTTNKIAV